MKILCDFRLILSNFVLIIFLSILLFSSNVMSQTCLTGATTYTTTGTDAIDFYPEASVESRQNYIDNGNSTADVELTQFTYWSWTTPRFRDYHDRQFIFAISYTLSYLLADTTFQGTITIHFPSCWKTDWERIDSIPWTYGNGDDQYDSVLGYYRTVLNPCDYANCCSVTFTRIVFGIGSARHFYLELVSLNLDSTEQCSTSPDSCYNVCKSEFWPETSIDAYWDESSQGPYYYRAVLDLPGPGGPTRKSSGDYLTKFNSSISMQPNPAHNKLKIKFISPEKGNYSYSIYDYQGNFIETINIAAMNGVFNYELDLSKYIEGVYFIKSNDAVSAMIAASFVVIK
jgi:hypothetical protein